MSQQIDDLVAAAVDNKTVAGEVSANIAKLKADLADALARLAAIQPATIDPADSAALAQATADIAAATAALRAANAP